MRARLSWTCSSCLQAQRSRVVNHAPAAVVYRFLSTAPPLPSPHASLRQDEADNNRQKAEKEEGAMSRRLSEMTEDSIAMGGRSAAKNVEAVGFSEDLKKQLEARIAESAFRSQNQRAFAEAEIPSSAGKGTRDQATAQPWTGSESLHDSSLRMLDDSHKRLRGIRAPQIPQPTILRPAPRKAPSTGQRLAIARDNTSIYATALSNEMSDEERKRMRRELKERFTPGARPMPTTLQGLTSLANERIEDAIARGQFKNIPRGKGKNIERDYNASSPFLDTTEYFMNKIIQRQEIVPPWIEKQQELVKSVASFRGRLRNDWKRHAARMIASKGGSLESQIRRAQAYALAEERVNPLQTKVESLSKIDSQGSLSTVTVQEIPQRASPPAAPLPTGKEPSATEGVRTEATPTSSTITITETPEQSTAPSPSSSPQHPSKTTTIITTTTPPPSNPLEPQTPPPQIPTHPLPFPIPFRDSAWERTESGYHTLSISTLNSLTRSYNLMAPSLAQKPYYSLCRELNRCYAEVAPLLPEEIRIRAQGGGGRVREGEGENQRGILGRIAGGEVGARWRGHEGRVRDEDLESKGYGFRQFWRDLFARGVRERERERDREVGA